MDRQTKTKKHGMAALLGVLIIGVILISGGIGGGPSEEDSNETRSGPGSAPYNQLCHYDQSLNKCVGICQAIMGPSECEQPVCIMTDVANKICECVPVVENCSPNCSCMSPAGAFNQGYELCPMQKSVPDALCNSHEAKACELLSGGYGLCYEDLECVPVEICPEGCTCLSPEDACNESLCNDTEILCEVDGGLGFCFETGCGCDEWEEITFQPISIYNDNSIECGGATGISTTSGTPITVNADYLCNPTECLASFDWNVFSYALNDVIDQGTDVASGSGFDFIPQQSSGWDSYLVTLFPECNGTNCTSCQFTMRVNVNVTSPCQCGEWNDANNDGISDVTVEGDVVNSEGTITVTTADVTIYPDYQCQGNCSSITYEWKITWPGGSSVSPALVHAPIELSYLNDLNGPGEYVVTLVSHCDGDTCHKFRFNLVIVEPQSQNCTGDGCECFLTGDDAADLGYTEFCNESCILDGTAAWCWKKPECPDCIISYWQLDETAGTTVMDSNNGNDGTLVGGPIWTPGIVDGALQFDGGNSVNIPHNSNLNFATAPFALEAWIKYEGPTDGSVEFPTIMSKRPAGTNPNGGFFLGLSYWSGATPGSLIMRMDDINYVPGTTSVDDGNWHHIVVQRCANNSLQFWIDGALDVTETSNKNINSNADLRFGFDSSSSHSTAWEGALDEVAVYYKCCLSANEIAEHYQSGLNHEGYC